MTEAIRGNVLAMIAEMECKVGDTTEKASHTDVEQEMIKKAIIQALQGIENSALDRLSGLEAIKNFLSHLATQDLGLDVNDYIKGELESANSYKPDQDLVDKLKKDEDNLKAEKSDVERDNKAMADLDRKLDKLGKELRDALKTLGNGSFWEKIKAFFEVAGFSVAIDALEIGKGVLWLDLKHHENYQEFYKGRIGQEKQALRNDPNILKCLGILSSGDRLAASQVNQKLSMHQSLVNDVSEVENTINAMVKMFHSA